MGYALFFARKLSLTARVNQMNAQLMMVSNEQMRLTDQIASKQQAANMSNNNAKMKAISTYKSALDQGTDEAKAKAAYEEAMAKSDNDKSTSDLDIMGLQMKVDSLDLRRKYLETQLNVAQQELESVEKAEENAIKASTPKYK